MKSQQMQIIRFEKDTVIFWQGDVDKMLYKILSGKVSIYTDYKKDHEIRLAILQKGQCFGEMSILEDCPRSATAVVDEDVSLAAYPEHMMGTFIYQNPAFALELMKNMSERLRNSTNELKKMHQMLLQLSEKKNVDKDIEEYVRRHTVYEPDGAARFRLKI